MEDAAPIPLPTELVLHIAEFISFREQIPTFTLLSKNVRQEFEKVVLCNLIKKALKKPTFEYFKPNSNLFTNVLEEIASQRNFALHPVGKINLVRSMGEFCFRYCTNFTATQIKPTLQALRENHTYIVTKMNWDKLFSNFKITCTSDQKCSISKLGSAEAVWHSFYFPSILFKAISGVTYWFSFLLNEYNPTSGSNVWKILLGISDATEKLSNLKLFSHSKLNYAFIVGTGEKLNGYGSGNFFADLNGKNFRAGDVVTFSLEFIEDIHCPVNTIRMQLSVFQNLRPLGVMFSRCVPLETTYHPICALCETSEVTFRMDGIQCF